MNTPMSPIAALAASLRRIAEDMTCGGCEHESVTDLCQRGILRPADRPARFHCSEFVPRPEHRTTRLDA